MENAQDANWVTIWIRKNRSALKIPKNLLVIADYTNQTKSA